jgi:hypothetical protein
MPKPVAKAWGEREASGGHCVAMSIAQRSVAIQHVGMKTLSWIALILVAGCVSVFGSGCGNGDGEVTNVCACNSCSHPYGACPGETLPNSCPGESDGSQTCPCPSPGATAGVSGVTYICQNGIWTAEADAALQENSD